MPRLVSSLSRLPTARVVSVLGVSGMSLFLGAADNTCVIRIETPEPVCAAIAVECREGFVPADLDGDGCDLECAAIACPDVAPPRCPEGEPIDLDGDGCALECRGDDVICPAIAIECDDGFRPTAGDGCALECVDSRDGSDDDTRDGRDRDGRDRDGRDRDGRDRDGRDRDGRDRDGRDRDDDTRDDDTRDGRDRDTRDDDTRDGRDDVVCPMIAVECAGGQAPIDANDDGCALECEDGRDDGRDADPADGRDGRDADPADGRDGRDDVVCPMIAVECADGYAPVDVDGDGCALECSAR